MHFSGPSLLEAKGCLVLYFDMAQNLGTSQGWVLANSQTVALCPEAPIWKSQVDEAGTLDQQSHLKSLLTLRGTHCLWGPGRVAVLGEFVRHQSGTNLS